MTEQSGEQFLFNTGSTDNPTLVSKAILDGYAPGNELYTFSDFPAITSSELSELSDESYETIFNEITKKLLGSSIPDDVLKSIAEDAYSADNFDLDEDGSLRFTTLASGVHIVGLSDGPTGAFKDMAMQPFARWMSYLQQIEGGPLTIMLSTTGDTGPAALKAFSGLEHTEIINMLPKKGVSRFQWSQMAELADQEGVHVLEVDGDFSYINDLHMRADLNYDLSSVNSVNIARIIAQIPYYVASYLKAIKLKDDEIGDPVDVSIPSGNFGNGLSAITARKMGLPIRRIILATNENNTIDTLIRDGVFKLSEFKHTDSSAQDVKMPSNIWRYFAMMYGNDPEKISHVYKELKRVGSVAINEVGIVDETVRDEVYSTTIDTKTRAQTIKDVYETSHRTMIDPHTANGVAAIEKLQAIDPRVPMLAMETAKPFKFNETMYRILGAIPTRPERFQGLEERQTDKKLFQIANELELMAYLESHTRSSLKQVEK
jgi:threonine synthase